MWAFVWGLSRLQTGSCRLLYNEPTELGSSIVHFHALYRHKFSSYLTGGSASPASRSKKIHHQLFLTRGPMFQPQLLSVLTIFGVTAAVSGIRKKIRDLWTP